MREHLIENRPALLREEDQWMIDRWSTPEQHEIRRMYRVGAHAVRFFRLVCSCGWRSPDSALDWATRSRCPVAVALAERMDQRAKPTERIEWLPVVDG